MAAEAGTGQRYATQVGRLWSGLAGTLTRLDAIAADPSRLEEDDTPAILRGLQYRLHLACERAYGLAPPTGTEPIHVELAAALEGARDATAEIADALEIDEIDAAQLFVHEWRGALFRVRLARMRLAGPRRGREASVGADAPPRPAAFVALVLAAVGAVVFMLGASDGQWPVWAIGIAALCGSFLVYKP